MKVRVWGVRGSQASPGPDTAGYGGNTSCFDVVTDSGSLLVLDAGTGIRRLGAATPPDVTRVDILLSHLHLDHIQGLGFYEPLHRPGLEVNIWGPASSTMSLRDRLSRYLSPPLFPVRLRDLPCKLTITEVPFDEFELPGATVLADLVCHPGPTVGYRIEHEGAVLTYLPDHEPALGSHDFPSDVEWMSGIDLAKGADLLLHDSQYSHAEYEHRVGWGHSTDTAALEFAVAAGAEHLVLVHFDPTHDDASLDARLEELRAAAPPELTVSAAREGDEISVG